MRNAVASALQNDTFRDRTLFVASPRKAIKGTVSRAVEAYVQPSCMQSGPTQ
jgi:hypothetical protein